MMQNWMTAVINDMMVSDLHLHMYTFEVVAFYFVDSDVGNKTYDQLYYMMRFF